MIKASIPLLMLALVASACSQIAGNLREDLDDVRAVPPSPTVGGTWQERGLLSSDSRNVNHFERAPASSGYTGSPEGHSWVDSKQDDENRRNVYRAPLRYSERPQLPPKSKSAVRYDKRATASDFIDKSPDEGSLWASSGQTNYYFTKNKIKSVGDIVTLGVQDSFVSNVALEIKKTLNGMEIQRELQVAQEKINQEFLKKYQEEQKANRRAPAGGAQGGQQAAQKNQEEKEEPEIPEPPKASLQDIEIKERIGLKEGDEIMAEIVERYPNGNYKVRGTKRVPFGDGVRMVTVIGIAKSDELNDDAKVETGKLYEYRVKAYR